MSSTQSKEIVLSDKDEAFIVALFDNGGNVRGAAREAGFNPDYGYALYKRLARPIAEAAQDYMAIHSVRAAQVVVEHMDKEMPNPIHLTAAQAVLDRAGVIRKDFTIKEEVAPTIKANIFILPEKRALPIIDATFTED